MNFLAESQGYRDPISVNYITDFFASVFVDQMWEIWEGQTPKMTQIFGFTK